MPNIDPDVYRKTGLDPTGHAWTAELGERTGVPLSTLLAEVGVQPAAKWILAVGADAAPWPAAFRIEKAWDDALVAYAQNGERLRAEQGYPLRLFLPGFEGNMSVKWLCRLKVGGQPFQTREETSKYTDLAGGQQLREPGFHEITGLAWAYPRRGRFDRWRNVLAVSFVAGACLAQMSNAVSPAMDLG